MKKPNRRTYNSSPPGQSPIEPATLNVVGNPMDAGLFAAHARIGAIASVWSLFEQNADDLLWTLSRIDHEIGACLTSQMGSVLNRLNAAKSLLQLKCVTNELSQKRNRCVHDPVTWLEDSLKITVQRIYTSKKGVLEYKHEDYDDAFYRETRNEIVLYEEAFCKFRERVLTELGQNSANLD